VIESGLWIMDCVRVHDWAGLLGARSINHWLSLYQATVMLQIGGLALGAFAQALRELSTPTGRGRSDG
jgi:hypothetical protein